MLYIGHRDGKDIWLGMLPWQFLDGHSEDTSPGYCSGSTHMSPHHYRQLVMIIALVLEKMGHLAYTCHDTYGIDLESRDPRFTNYTNAM